MAIIRASKSMVNRSWGALVVEFLVIVIGFFVSLQVNEWQNNRENRELELQYLLRLENDFDRSSIALRESIEGMQSSIDRMEEGLSILVNEERNPEDHQVLFHALQGSSMMGGFDVYFGTFEELKDTGNMRLIESTRLRESLGNVWQKYLQVSRISEIRNLLRGNTFPVVARYVTPSPENRLTFDVLMVDENPRELYVAMSILRTNLRYDSNDSEELLNLVNLSLGIIRDEVEIKR